jgi:hypothetical protein
MYGTLRIGPATIIGATALLMMVGACKGPNPAFWPWPPMPPDAGAPRDAPADRGSILDQSSAAPDLVAVVDLGAAGPDRATEVAPDVPPDLAPPPPDLAPDTPARTIVLSSQLNFGATHGGDGGSAHSEPCPGHQVVLGYVGEVGSDGRFVRSLRGTCGVLAVAAGTNKVSATPKDLLPHRGGSGGIPFDTHCPVDQVVVGVKGRSGNFVDTIQFVCAPLTVGAAGKIVIGPSTPLALVGGDTGADVYDEGCPAGQVLRGNLISDGANIDAYTMICSLPSVAP